MGRVALEVGLFVAALALLGLIAKGLGPVAPALAGLLRFAIHPLGILLLLALFLLLRLGGSRRRRLHSSGDGEG